MKEVDELSEKNLKRLREEGWRDSYGIRITIGPDGVPRIERFGTLVDVVERDDEICVIAEVPRIPKEDIDVKVAERTVTIKARSDEKKYHKIVDLPAEVDPETATVKYRSGILKVKIKKRRSEGMKV